MFRLIVGCVFVGGCLVTPVMHFGAGKSAKEAQHDTMASFGPARLVPDEKWNGEIATKKIRVWADDQYRTQNIHWQDTFGETLELANVVLEPIFGLHLVAEYAVWERDEPGATLTGAIKALQERDPGDDVFAVVGLTSSLPLVSATFDELGLAGLGGSHIMLRGYADLEERKLYADAFPDLRAEERELALEHLRQHKTAVTLLHELGHVLGVAHEIGADSIMNATYSNHATRFTPESRQVMLHNVDERLHRGTAPSTATVVTASAPAVEKPPVVIVHHDPIIIRVTRKRETIVGGKRVTSDALTELLKSAYAQDPTTKIVINEDRNVPTGVVSDLIDKLHEIGFARAEFAWSGK